MFIVDIGGGTTEVAVVTSGHLVRAQSLRLGGNAMDEAIVSRQGRPRPALGRNAARNLKMNLGLTDAGTGWVETVGVDVASRNPRVEHVPGRLVAGALEHIVAMIVSSVREMLSDIPPNLAEDVVRGKIRLAGGGALLPGLSSRIEVATGIPVCRRRPAAVRPPGSGRDSRARRGALSRRALLSAAGRPGTGGGEAAPLLPPAAPARLALVQERPHPFLRVRQLAGRRHHTTQSRMPSAGRGELLVERALAEALLSADPRVTRSIRLAT